MPASARAAPVFDITTSITLSLNLALVVVNDMRVAVSEQTLSSPLATNSTLLVAAENGLWGRLLPTVDKDTAGLQTKGNALGCLDILAPDTGAETGIGVVGAGNDFFFV